MNNDSIIKVTTNKVEESVNSGTTTKYELFIECGKNDIESKLVVVVKTVKTSTTLDKSYYSVKTTNNTTIWNGRESLTYLPHLNFKVDFP